MDFMCVHVGLHRLRGQKLRIAEFGDLARFAVDLGKGCAGRGRDLHLHSPSAVLYESSPWTEQTGVSGYGRHQISQRVWLSMVCLLVALTINHSPSPRCSRGAI
jgi:hypothetical protein